MIISSVCEKSFQMCIGIKYIIIITDNSICPHRKIQCKFKRTDLELFCLFLDLLSPHSTAIFQKVIDCIINPVKMSFCIGAGLRITLCFFTKADFSLAVRVTERNFSPFSFKIKKACSATVLVIVLAVR